MYKILIVEDVEVVADIQILMLIRAGIAFEARRVESAEDFSRQVELAVPDAILYSASMPQFSGFVALAKAQSLCPDTPFIFVSGTHSKETGAEARDDGLRFHDQSRRASCNVRSRDQGSRGTQKKKGPGVRDRAPVAHVRRSGPRAGAAQRSTRHPSQAEPLSQGRRDAGRNLLGHRMFRPSIVPGHERQAVPRSSSGQAPGVGRHLG